VDCYSLVDVIRLDVPGRNMPLAAGVEPT
jgi:hypothetical protein